MGRVFVFGMAGLIVIGLMWLGIVMLRLALWKPKRKIEERSDETGKSVGEFCTRCGAPVFSRMFHQCGP